MLDRNILGLMIFYGKTKHFNDWLLKPSSGGAGADLFSHHVGEITGTCGCQDHVDRPRHFRKRDIYGHQLWDPDSLCRNIMEYRDFLRTMSSWRVKKDARWIESSWIPASLWKFYVINILIWSPEARLRNMLLGGVERKRSAVIDLRRTGVEQVITLELYVLCESLPTNKKNHDPWAPWKPRCERPIHRIRPCVCQAPSAPSPSASEPRPQLLPNHLCHCIGSLEELLVHREATSFHKAGTIHVTAHDGSIAILQT